MGFMTVFTWDAQLAMGANRIAWCLGVSGARDFRCLCTSHFTLSITLDGWENKIK